MNELDKIIGRISEIEEEPADSHFERFQHKLQKNKGKQHYQMFLKVAAVLVFVFLSADLYLYLKDGLPKKKPISAKTNEINEAGAYYNLQINNEMNQLEQLVIQGAGSKKDLEVVKNEFSEMDNLYQNLRKDYQSNPNDERLQNAMIQYFQSKLEILNIVKSNMEFVKQQKLKYHENNKI